MNVTWPLDPVVPLKEEVAPVGLVTVTDTEAPATGAPFAATVTVM